jgi:HSP20 family molecular chaperone IbpA
MDNTIIDLIMSGGLSGRTSHNHQRRSVTSSNRQTSRVKPIPVNITETNENITIYAELPGCVIANISVEVFQLTLQIKSIKNVSSEETKEMSVNEIQCGSFERNINLPICITKKETVTMTYVNGILKIHIDRTKENESRFILTIEE